MNLSLPWILAFGLALVVLVLREVRMRRKPPAPAHYTPSLEEIMETDRKLRILGGFDPEPAPKKKPEPRKPSSSAESDDLP